MDKAQRRAKNKELDKYLKGRFVWKSCYLTEDGKKVPQQGTYVKAIHGELK